MRRPTGISIIAIVTGAIGLWNLVFSYSLLWLGGWASWVSLWTGMPPTDLPPAYASLGASAFWLGLLALAVAIATLVGAVGLWSLSPWARWLAVGGLTFGLCTNIFTGLGGIITISGVGSSLLAIIALVYLFLPHVSRAFERQSTPEPSAP